jgi:hypothetical protein
MSTTCDPVIGRTMGGPAQQKGLTLFLRTVVVGTSLRHTSMQSSMGPGWVAPKKKMLTKRCKTSEERTQADHGISDTSQAVLA